MYTKTDGTIQTLGYSYEVPKDDYVCSYDYECLRVGCMMYAPKPISSSMARISWVLDAVFEINLNHFSTFTRYPLLSGIFYQIQRHISFFIR